MDDTILLFGACSLNMINLRVSSKIKLELIYLFIFFLFIIFGGKNGAQRKLFELSITRLENAISSGDTS